jgi:hypothetical protein
MLGTEPLTRCSEGLWSVDTAAVRGHALAYRRVQVPQLLELNPLSVLGMVTIAGESVLLLAMMDPTPAKALSRSQ